jgi:hypothetical protein
MKLAILLFVIGLLHEIVGQVTNTMSISAVGWVMMVIGGGVVMVIGGVTYLNGPYDKKIDNDW